MSYHTDRKQYLKPALARKLSATSTVSSRSSSDSHSRPASLVSSGSTGSKRSNVSSFFNAFTLARSSSHASLTSGPPRSSSSEGLAWHLPEYEKQAGERGALTPWEAYLPFSAGLQPEPVTNKKKEFEMTREEMEFRGIKADRHGRYPSYSSSLSPTGPTYSALPSPPKRLPVMIASTTAPVIPAQYPPLPWTSTPPDNVVPYIAPSSTAAASSVQAQSGRVITKDAPPRPARTPRPTTSPSLPSVPTMSYVSISGRSSTGHDDGDDDRKRGSLFISSPVLQTQSLTTSSPRKAPSPLPSTKSFDSEQSFSIDVPTRTFTTGLDETADGSFTSIGSSFEGLSIISPSFGDFTSSQAEESGRVLRWSGSSAGMMEDIAEGLFLLDLEDQWSDIDESPVAEEEVVPVTIPAGGLKSRPAPITAPSPHLFVHSGWPVRNPRSPMSQQSPRIRRISRRKTLGLPPLPSSSIRRYQQKRGRRLSIVIESNSLSQSFNAGHPFAIPLQEDDFPVDVSPDEANFF